MDDKKLEAVKFRSGFIAALDQSGGSTGKTLEKYGIPASSYSTEEEMFELIHEMRKRVFMSKAFTSDKIMGAILFYKTMMSKVGDEYTADYLWDEKHIVSFLKVDKGLQDEATGCKLMKDIPDLKEQLMNSVEDIDDPLARARKLYLELNKNLSYNETYSALTYIDNTELIDEMIDNANNSTANLDNLIDDKVICIEWAQLYYDTLISAGFSPDDVMIKGDSGHKWVTFKLPNGKVVIADATDSMEGSYDLANSRLGDETRGFVITGVENANLRLTDNKALTSQLLADQYSQIRELDRSIKYADENGYFSDQVRAYTRLSGMMDANYDPTEMFMECLEAEIPSTYTGQEAWIYFRKVAINIYNYGIIKEHMKNSLYPLLINGKLEIINEVSFEYNGKTLYRFYSESTGNHIFDNAADRDAYKATLETFERGDM